MEYRSKLNELLTTTARENASDLHISVGKPPVLRINSALVPVAKEAVITPETSEGLVLSLLGAEQKKKLLEQKQIDFSYSLDNKARFRVSAYYQQGSLSAALRLIPTKIKTVEELNLPTILHNFAKLSQGFILFVGPSGQGKSTSLAAILDEINHQRTEHILTIEDPIEFLFTQDRSVFSQREVGLDALTFHDGLRSVLRQDPDVIMIGEMRDKESIAAALTAAETGHLVFSTLHTNSASQTVDRIIDSFPAEQQNQVAAQLASALVGIISQRLVPKIDGGLVPAYEVMINNTAIRNLIREKKSYQIDLVIETGLQEGMITLNRSLAQLIGKKMISLENAEIYSNNTEELRDLLGR